MGRQEIIKRVEAITLLLIIALAGLSMLVSAGNIIFVMIGGIKK